MPPNYKPLKWIDRQTDRQTDRHTDTQTDRQAGSKEMPAKRKGQWTKGARRSNGTKLRQTVDNLGASHRGYPHTA